MKKIIPFILIAIVSIGFIGAIAYVAVTQDKPSAVQTEVYFDENATVMYFYSENCSHCIEQKPILTELASEGFRVKPVDVLSSENAKIAADNKVESTPTFLSQKDGERLVGFQKKEVLRAWLEQHQ